MSSELRRIGREPTTAERAYQLTVENDHVLERVTRNLYAYETGGVGLALTERWMRLPESEREMWRAKALEKMRQHAIDCV